MKAVVQRVTRAEVRRSADATAVHARVRLLLTLRAMLPRAATLDEVLDEPMARAVLCASTEGRKWAMKRYRRWCERARRAG